MSFTVPAAAMRVPIQVELQWDDSMPTRELRAEFSIWDRQDDRALVYTGKLIDLKLVSRPLNPDDKEWLQAIGARA